MLATLARGALKLLLAAILFLGTLETYLTWWGDTLPPRLGNYAFSKYGAFPGGMYFHDSFTNINFLKREFETEAYFNGYRWHHGTDSLGFRNPPDLAQHRVLLLGDSLIYGHGVDESETVAHRLRSEHGVDAYNMARQGDCIYQNYVLLRLHAAELEPTEVVLFVFLNDFHDVMIYRNREEIRTRPEADWDYAALRTRLDELSTHRSLHPRLLLGLSSLRLLRGLAGRLPSVALVRSAEAEPMESPAPPTASRQRVGGLFEDELPYVRAVLDPPFFARIAGYYEATLQDLEARLAASGTTLRVVHLDFDLELGETWRTASERLARFLVGACRRLEIPFDSTESLFTDCAECFLPGDGHLSPEGHRRLASWLARREAVAPATGN